MEKEQLEKKLSSFIPTRKGWLAVANGIAVAVIIPTLIPFYDPLGVNWIKIGIGSLLAISTGVICLHCLKRGRGVDRLIAFLTAAIAVRMFYLFIHSVDYYVYETSPRLW